MVTITTTGLTIDRNTGVLSGSATQTDASLAQPMPVKVVATDKDGQETSIEFMITVNAFQAGKC